MKKWQILSINFLFPWLTPNLHRWKFCQILVGGGILSIYGEIWVGGNFNPKKGKFLYLLQKVQFWTNFWNWKIWENFSNFFCWLGKNRFLAEYSPMVDTPLPYLNSDKLKFLFEPRTNTSLISQQTTNFTAVAYFTPSLNSTLSNY